MAAFDDAIFSNSAEVEQETEQSNECGLAICANVIGVQSQIGAATVTNALVATFDDAKVTNSAEVEQETEQSNECRWQSVPTSLV